MATPPLKFFSLMFFWNSFLVNNLFSHVRPTFFILIQKPNVRGCRRPVQLSVFHFFMIHLEASTESLVLKDKKLLLIVQLPPTWPSPKRLKSLDNGQMYAPIPFMGWDSPQKLNYKRYHVTNLLQALLVII